MIVLEKDRKRIDVVFIEKNEGFISASKAEGIAFISNKMNRMDNSLALYSKKNSVDLHNESNILLLRENLIYVDNKKVLPPGVFVALTEFYLEITRYLSTLNSAIFVVESGTLTRISHIKQLIMVEVYRKNKQISNVPVGINTTYFIELILKDKHNVYSNMATTMIIINILLSLQKKKKIQW